MINRAAVSNGDDLSASEMEPHDVWQLIRLEVATHGIADIAFQRSEVVRFREDRFAKRSGRESAFGSFLDEKDDLVHTHQCTDFDARTAGCYCATFKMGSGLKLKVELSILDLTPF